MVAKIGSQIGEAFLGLNARAIPRQQAVDDKGVAGVMEPRSPASWLRLSAGPSHDIGQQMPEGHQLVALAFPLIPEERGRGYRARGALRTDREIGLQHREETRPEREVTRLEELGVVYGEDGISEIEIAKGQADEFA